MLSNQQCFLLLVVVLKFQAEQETIPYHRFFQRDLDFCPECFHSQSAKCAALFSEIDFDDTGIGGVVLAQVLELFLTGRRQIRLLKIKSHNEQIVGKYLGNLDFDSNAFQLQRPLTVSQLSSRFFNETRLDGVQFCSQRSITRLIDLFQYLQHSPPINTWTHLLVNVQPILLPLLYAKGFPVPKTYGTCGFTVFQSFDGTPLVNFYSSGFQVKLKIAQRLIEGVQQFSDGFDGFRIYITDLNADNMVYNVTLDRLSFVDLDTVLIVDSIAATGSGNTVGDTHKHKYIECDDCFAYSPNDICGAARSDINLFAVCQFLREDLKKDYTKGFLHPIPEDIRTNYPDLETKLTKCVDCSSNRVGDACSHRFDAIEELLSIIKTILLKNT